MAPSTKQRTSLRLEGPAGSEYPGEDALALALLTAGRGPSLQTAWRRFFERGSAKRKAAGRRWAFMAASECARKVHATERLQTTDRTPSHNRAVRLTILQHEQESQQHRIVLQIYAPGCVVSITRSLLHTKSGPGRAREESG